MILEIALLNVHTGKETAFENSFKEAKNIISNIPGFISLNLKKSAEYENRYLLMVRWEKIENHKIDFRKSDEYQEWKKILHPYYNPVPKVEYFEDEDILSS